MSIKKTAVCYLTRIPDGETIEFAEQLARDSRLSSNTDIYIMIDDNNYQIQSNSLINFIQINNNECITNGYHSSNKLEMNKDCISWDKALYYFCQVKQMNYSFVWLIEDDTFIPSVDAFVSLHEKYSKEGQGDLICQRNEENLYGNTSTWKWSDVVGKFSPPWYHSMVCAIGCSRKLLDTIANYAQQKRFLPFIEYMFNTLAMQNHLKVVIAPELSTIVFRENWTWEHVQQRPNNWFHPFKNEHIRRDNRLKLANAWKAPPQNTEQIANVWQIPSQNTGYQGNTQCQGQMPQYPYYMEPSYCPPPPPPNSGNVISSLVYPPNVPPPYPPH
ncbi:unnamed protein product [Adineta steineri]|uniref:Uncharacterized protein n=1 Tax=Adineta steineri TaxID=433720 RepID=A0A814MZ65_9BILA|nr:unnamed protein product [Adineta steineri]CAF3687725.1 unnamed protein product [Adineta steineri]